MSSKTFLTLLFAFGCSVSAGQVLIPHQSGNQVAVTVTTQVSLDDASKLYTYRYTVTNATTSKQEVWLFAISFSGDLKPTILNPLNPHGWTFATHLDRSMVSWAATEFDDDPAGEDDGNIASNPYQIKPGQTLAEFSFQSPQPPDVATVYAQGFTKLAAVNDAGDLNEDIQDFTDESYVTIATAPRGPSIAAGSGGPSVDGFLIFQKPKNNGVYSFPLEATLKFGIHGESVDRTTLNVTLNDQDVTSQFRVSGADLTATFQTGGSLLLDGKNVFRALVMGIDPTTGMLAPKLSRIAFFINSSGKTDLDGDGATNCTDLAIIRASLGKKVGQSGFDPRSDVNKDDLVDIRDQALVSKQLPSGTRCQ